MMATATVTVAMMMMMLVMAALKKTKAVSDTQTIIN